MGKAFDYKKLWTKVGAPTLEKNLLVNFQKPSKMSKSKTLALGGRFVVASTLISTLTMNTHALIGTNDSQVQVPPQSPPWRIPRPRSISGSNAQSLPDLLIRSKEELLTRVVMDCAFMIDWNSWMLRWIAKASMEEACKEAHLELWIPWRCMLGMESDWFGHITWARWRRRLKCLY